MKRTEQSKKIEFVVCGLVFASFYPVVSWMDAAFDGERIQLMNAMHDILLAWSVVWIGESIFALVRLLKQHQTDFKK